jgi:hypothetical protein
MNRDTSGRREMPRVEVASEPAADAQRRLAQIRDLLLRAALRDGDGEVLAGSRAEMGVPCGHPPAARGEGKSCCQREVRAEPSEVAHE